MGNWIQIRRHFAKTALLAGALYCRILRIRRRLQIRLHQTGRTWTIHDRPTYHRTNN